MVCKRTVWLLWPFVAWIASVAIGDEARRFSAPKTMFNTVDTVLRPSALPVEDAPPSDPAEKTMFDPAVQPAHYIAHHPHPDEPLGFSGAKFLPGDGVDPGLNGGFLVDDPIGEFADPLDPDAPAPVVSSGEWLRSGCWYTEQSVVYMIRNVSVKNETRLAFDFSSSRLPTEWSHLDIAPEMGYQPGLRSTFGRFLGRDPRNRDHAVEFTFLGLTHWQDATSLTAFEPGNLFSEINLTRDLPAFNASDFQSYAQTSKFNSYELNYRINRRLSRDQMVYTRDSTWVRQATRAPLIGVFAGIRVISIAETLEYLATSSTANGSYNIATHNNLVGVQAGGDWFIEHYEWRLGGRAKVGSLVNWSNQSSRVRILDTDGAPLEPNRDEFADLHNLAFVGELNFIGAYQFNPHFAFRTSYDLMWVTNLALAQNQITFSPSTPPQISGLHSLFYQGFSLGFELSR